MCTQIQVRGKHTYDRRKKGQSGMQSGCIREAEVVS